MTPLLPPGTAAGSALALAGAYALVAGAYIVVSGRVAAAIAADVEDLATVEQVKGIAFVLITSALLYGLAYALLRRVSRYAEEVAASRQALLRADRHATPGLLAASVAHDFQNLLTVVRTNVELAHEAHGLDEASLDDLHAAIDQASELARALSRAGRSAATGAPVSADAVATVRETLKLLSHHPLARSRQVAFDGPRALAATFHPTLVQQIVTNLVVNALEATSAGGRVLVRVAPCPEGFTLEVHDDGPGVAPEVASTLFRPFQTTKPHGTGLGLLSVRTCAELHQGTVSFARSEELGGAELEVRLGAPAPP